ncbi:MAG TPA: hypothetical protein VGJ84_18560 [Polyangiaceae bacterium]
MGSAFCLLLGCGMRVIGPGTETPDNTPESGLAPDMPSALARCKVAASRENPLVTEWPASEKANLQALLQQGAVVVAYGGCTLRVLPQCRVRGSYSWHRTTTASDMVEIRDADELYTKLPLGAVSLEGELQRSGRLAVQTTVSGQLQLNEYDPRSAHAGGACSGATHVVNRLSVGAFKLHSGGLAKAGGGASVIGIASGSAATSREETTLREAGSPTRCEQSTDAAPDAECASPIQMFLQPLPDAIAQRGPPGMLKVKFLPPPGLERWDVMTGKDQTMCTAPCEKWVDPAVSFTLKHDPGWWARNQYIELPDLRPFADQGAIEVGIEPIHGGELAGGVVAVSLGGIAAGVGVGLLATGCGKNSQTCVAGGVTLPLGLAAVGGGVWLIVDSRGAFHIKPTAEAMAAP